MLFCLSALASRDVPSPMRLLLPTLTQLQQASQVRIRRYTALASSLHVDGMHPCCAPSSRRSPLAVALSSHWKADAMIITNVQNGEPMILREPVSNRLASFRPDVAPVYTRFFAAEIRRDNSVSVRFVVNIFAMARAPSGPIALCAI